MKNGVSSFSNLNTNSHTNSQTRSYNQNLNKQIITNANNVSNPLIPIAVGIGGEVIIACAECEKTLSKFILKCVDEEANGVQTQTLRSFCESARDKPFFHINLDTCLILNAKLASITGETGADMIDPTKAPGLCVKFKNGIFLF